MMHLNTLQLLQLKQYTDTCVTLDRFVQIHAPKPNTHGPAYWSERADLEEDKRNKLSAFDSSLTWAADKGGA